MRKDISDTHGPKVSSGELVYGTFAYGRWCRISEVYLPALSLLSYVYAAFLPLLQAFTSHPRTVAKKLIALNRALKFIFQFFYKLLVTYFLFPTKVFYFIHFPGRTKMMP
jgi:hypothetical protein